MRHGPPEVVRLDIQLRFQLGRNLIVQTRRKQAQVGCDEIELVSAIVHRQHAVVDGIVNGRMLPWSVAEQPLRRLRCDVYLHRGGSKLTHRQLHSEAGEENRFHAYRVILSSLAHVCKLRF